MKIDVRIQLKKHRSMAPDLERSSHRKDLGFHGDILPGGGNEYLPALTPPRNTVAEITSCGTLSEEGFEKSRNMSKEILASQKRFESRRTSSEGIRVR